MKFIEVAIVIFFILILAKVYVGVTSDEKNNEVIKHKKIYTESQERLKKATEILETEYEKYRDPEGSQE